jgi:type IV pilus secretin PilQ/predicted competence protein
MRKRLYRFSVLCSGVALAALPALAQEAALNAPAPPPPADSAPAAVALTTPAETATTVEAPASAPVPAAPAPAQPEARPAEAPPEPVVIDYNEADIQNVLRTLATKAGVNLVMGDEITGKVTVHLEGVSYEEAMQVIADSKGYAFVKDRNVARIKSKDAIDTEPLEVRFQTLSFAKAADIALTLGPMLTKRGKIQVDPRSNTLIISDTPSNLVKVMPLIDRLDTETPQVMIEAKFIETTKNPQKDLGINWSETLLNHEVVAGGSATSAGDPNSPATIVVGPDGKPVSGFQWVKPQGGSMLTPWNSGVALLDAGKAGMVFSYLSRDTDTELLANPRVVTTDNGKAKVAIAEQYPIPQYQFSESTGAFQISGFNYKDIGIVLTVQPRINKNDYVTMDVYPEASSRAGVATLASGSSSTQIPIIDTRSAQTTVLIKSGNTLAIGGLMRQDSSDFYTKVPVMGDLPGVGALFRSKSLSKTRRNLLIFLTPTIVRPDQQTGYEHAKNSLEDQHVYANDPLAPTDNAKPSTKGLKRFVPFSKAPSQNFGP